MNKKEEWWDIYDKNKHKTGKMIKRGDRMKEDEYHLFVQVWLVNNEGLYLAQERSENIKWPLMWCANGGNAKAGEDAYSCARREIKEELNLDLSKMDGILFDTSMYFEDNQNYFCDSFVFICNKKIEEFEFQKEEIKSLEYMDINRIRKMMKEKMFFTYDDAYLNKLAKIASEIRENRLDLNKYKKEI